MATGESQGMAIGGDSPSERRGIERRRSRVSLAWPDRRTGFDRRTARADSVRGRYQRWLLAYRRNSRTLALVLATITALNVADLLLTQRALCLGAVEGNPIMAMLFDVDPWVAGATKIGVGLIVVGVLWALRRYRRALEFSIVALAGMGLVFVYHLYLLPILPS